MHNHVAMNLFYCVLLYLFMLFIIGSTEYKQEQVHD